jgi:hypothetical protein
MGRRVSRIRLRVASRTASALVQGTVQAPLAALLHEDVRYVAGKDRRSKQRAHAVTYSFLTFNSQGHPHAECWQSRLILCIDGDFQPVASGQIRRSALHPNKQHRADCSHSSGEYAAGVLARSCAQSLPSEPVPGSTYAAAIKRRLRAALSQGQRVRPLLVKDLVMGFEKGESISAPDSARNV